MENSNVKENLEVLFEKFKNMIKVETVVGEAVQIGDTTLCLLYTSPSPRD